MKKVLGSVLLEIKVGDIADQPDMEAVINAANAMLAPGGGVAGAIHWAAGPRLYKECRSLAPIEPGQAVITGAYNLPNRYVIHCLGPVYGIDKPEGQLLAACYQNALHLAEEEGITTLAFPALSTGAFGYPMQEATVVALQTVLGLIPTLSKVKRIRFVLFNPEAEKIFKRTLEKILANRQI